MPHALSVLSPAPVLAALAASVSAQNFTAAPAPEWDVLFDRTSGWTGADGIYSHPVLSDEAANGLFREATFFTFSDTFIGEVGGSNQRVPGTTLVNNTAAFLRPGAPSSDRITFFYATEPNGDPRAMFIPNTPSSEPDEWYWPHDGLVYGGKLSFYGMRMQPAGAGGFKRVAVDLIEVPASDRPPFPNQVQTELPLTVPASGGLGSTFFGAGVFPNLVEARVPNPDGYVYVYGVREDPLVKKLLAARVLPDQMADGAAYEFYDGARWVSDIQRAAVLSSRVSNELSVSPYGDGRYVLVFQLDAIGSKLGARIGDSPVGPFGPVIELYTCPEPALIPTSYTYNAKAHPHLSEPRELLISYNVNSTDIVENFKNADIYRPRFVRVRLP